MIAAHRYRPTMAARWDAFVRASRNGTFLFERGFMDYHADRFADASLLFERDGDLLAVLPISAHGDVWRSHGGLTYGGLALGDRGTILDVMAVFDALAEAARSDGVADMIYKPVPWIYHRQPCEEDRHALFHHGAVLVEQGLDTVIDLRAPLAPSSRRRRGAARAAKAGLTVGRSDDPSAFHAMLATNLADRHGTDPVHTSEEMALLQGRFPDRIALWEARAANGPLQAGAWVFDCGPCVHAQYIASTAEGRLSGAVDLVLAVVIERAMRTARHFSLGISNEAGGRWLNEGLFRQKTEFGGRGVVCDTLRLSFDRR